jgi:N-acetylglucosamine kinase-like BadF-type ATPase
MVRSCAVKKYFLGVDGGGTKLLSLLFDEDLNFISSGVGGPINPNFSTLDQVKESMIQSITGCLPEGFREPIQCCHITMPGPAELYVELLSERCPVIESRRLSEGGACLLAGIQKKTGIVALAGTGSGAFYIVDIERMYHLGGWGSLVGDEGSGYDIGAKGLRAAIYSYDGRGPKTVLEEMFKSYFQVEDFVEIRSIIYKNPNYRSTLSKLCLLVLQAARQGDPCAVNIMKEAGKDMALQVTTLMKREGVPEKGVDIVVSGSVWKKNSHMFDSFKQEVQNLYPRIVVSKPLFEPAVGSVVFEAFRLYDEIDNDRRNHLKEQFQGFLYDPV